MSNSSSSREIIMSEPLTAEEALAKRLSSKEYLEESIKFRTVAGSKVAAYIPGDQVMLVMATLLKGILTSCLGVVVASILDCFTRDML